MPITDFAADFAKGFDETRGVLLGANAKLVLLREDGKTKAFNELLEILTGWYSEYSTFFGNTTFHVADLTAVTGGIVRKATHLIIRDSDLAASNNVLYELKSETAPPDANVPWWRIRTTALGRKYVAPEEI